jgi:uncharacterized protein
MKAIASNSSLVQEHSVWWRSIWFWLVVIGPIVVVFAGIATYIIAWQNADSLVTPDYYQKGLALSKSHAESANPPMLPARQARNHAATGGAATSEKSK